MGVNVDATGGHYFPFARDHLCSRSDDDVDVGLHVGIARLTDSGYPSVFDGDVRFHNSPMIENQRVGDDGIDRALAARTLRLTHPVTDDLPAAEFHFLAVDGEVLLHLDDQVRVGKAHFVADRWAKHLRV